MADVISSTDTSGECCPCLVPNVCMSVKSLIQQRRSLFSSILPHTDFTRKNLPSIINTKCIIPQSANKPITSFNWYQVFWGFYWLSRNSKGNHFSEPNTTFINPGFRSHYFSFQNKHTLPTHISGKWIQRSSSQKRFWRCCCLCGSEERPLKTASHGHVRCRWYMLPQCHLCLVISGTF